MTQEEAIRILQRLNPLSSAQKPSPEDAIRAIKLAIEALSVELPSNLDEAAHSYSESDEPLYSPGYRFHWDNESLFGKQIETAFKAGAEWMAAQGETCEGVIFGNKYFRHKNVEMHLSDEKYDKVGDFGDKVIVQIRKAK